MENLFSTLKNKIVDCFRGCNPWLVFAVVALLLLCACLAWAGVIHPAVAGVPLIGVAGAIAVRDDLSLLRTITYTHSSATVKDTAYYLNNMVMLAMNSAAENVKNVFVIGGLIEYAKVSAQAWTGGQKIYWDDGNSRFTSVFGANCYLAGYASEAAANPTSTGFVVLDPALAQPVGQIGLAEGSVLVGNSDGVSAAVDASGDAQILIGDGTTVASVPVSGDIAIDNTGAATIQPGAVEGAMLASGAGVAALLAAGLGASDSYVKTDNGTGGFTVDALVLPAAA